MTGRMPRPLRKRVEAFATDPASPRKATWVIIAVTVLTVLLGSIVIWLVDAEKDFPDFATALWFTLQTVTTVGYGDVTPTTSIGRVVGGVVMVVAIAFVTIVTALVTSTFVEAAQAHRRTVERDDLLARDDHLHQRLDDISERLAAIEERLDGRDPTEPRA